MKLSDIRPCDNCGGKLVPIFYFSKISLAVFSPKAVNEVMGMTQFFGGGSAGLRLAEMMGASAEEAIKIVGEEEHTLWTDIYLCQECIVEPINLGLLIEKVNHYTLEKGDGDVTGN